MTDAYNPATRPCASGTTKGCGYLQRAILGYWPAATNLGTFICRPTADGAPSVHGNGRAGDIGRDLALIVEIAGWLVANHTVLGVQLVIVNHKIWSVARSSEGWRPYGCDDPGSEKDHHTTHVHYEVNVDAGHYLTPGTIDSVRPHQPPNPDPQPHDESEFSMLPRCVHWNGAIFLVGYDGEVGEPWRRTFPNPSRLQQVVGGGGCVVNAHGNAFEVTNNQFEQVYADRGPA